MALWEYYKKIAQAAGTKDGQVQGFSVAWFYEENKPENLNVLTRAFLGDREALEGIACSSDEEAAALGEGMIPLCSERVNTSQLHAIGYALRDRISIIQGPPGTGKTETIGNLLRCLMHLPETPSVAVVSSNGEAIENIIRLVKDDFLLKGCYAQLGKWKLRKAFHDAHPDKAWSAVFSEENGYRFLPGLLQDYPIIFSTIHSLRKCFVTDEEFTGEFDYVIVDECSQVGNMLGLLAMASAKHLVLLGDDEQLAPVFSDKISSIEPEEGTQELYRDKDENSFMKAVVRRFEGHAQKSFLDQHYRCHPAIIGYCNQYIYDNKLRICTEEDGKLPIRIRWYEGDYWETHKEGKKNIHQNLRQIKIFMEEEYPGILDKLREDEDYSVCVLSPYNNPLQQLKEAMIAYNEREGVPFADPRIEGEDRREDEDYNPVEKIPQLTIHKAQGRGYDLVVLLTIADCGSNPWPQRKSMINVAVSRAKKELLIISSATWMPRKMQRELLGYSVKSGAERQESKLYLRRMMEYVREQSKQRETGDYGLQQSSLHSVFDRTMYYREKGYRDEKNQEVPAGMMSAPEMCLLYALCENDYIRDHYEIYREVPLADVSAIEAPDDACREYIENGARFDIVLVQNNKICVIIEVDGAYHRTDPAQKTKDDMKDAAVASLGEAFQNRYFRFPTDGTSENEVAQVVEALQADAENLPEVETAQLTRTDCMEGEIEQEDIMQEVQEQLEESFGRVQQVYRRGMEHREDRDSEEWKEFEKLLTVRFDRTGEGQDEDDEESTFPDYGEEIVDHFYLIRYANVYAFEYYTMYLLALALLEEGDEYVNSYSFGCGSLLDGMSLLYANRTLNNTPRIYYRGIDLTRWPVMFPVGDAPEDPMISLDITSMENLDVREKRCNIMFFPRMLSELTGREGEEILNAFAENIRQGKLSQNQIILCVSYRGKNTIREDWNRVKVIIAAIEDHGYSAEERANIPQGEEWIDQYFDHTEYMELDDHRRIHYYTTKEEYKNIPVWRVNNDFRIQQDILNYLNDESEFKNTIAEVLGENIRTFPRTNLADMCFHIISFRKRT
ncbi:MAG: AAA family ATPase [Lachnospiraceae bacterium]|nr:AAA family ATPase [Lachnospiraceae bacterium]